MAAKHKNVGYDVVEHIPLRILVPFLSLLPAISITVPAMGAEIQTKSYPLAFHVDLVYYLLTSLYIKCDVKEYNLSFPDFFSKENGIRESRFKELVFAIRANDLEKCLSMSFRQRGMKAEQIQKHNDKAKTWVSTACSWCFSEALAGEKLEKLKVVSQFYLGNGGLFVFGGDAESSTGSAPFRTKLSFVTGPEGTFWWSLENPDSLESLLVQTAGQMAISPTKFAAVEDRKLEYEVPLPQTNDTQHIAYLQFNGQKYHFKVFSDTIDPTGKPTDEVVSFFQNKYLLIPGGSPREALARFYSDRSREKYLKWIAKPESPAYLESYFTDMATRERTVRFVIDAEPLYIVLYRVQGQTPLYYEFIIRDPKDGELKFTNFFSSGFLDDLFIKEQFRGLLSERIGIK
jgi:hypothetical protein